MSSSDWGLSSPSLAVISLKEPEKELIKVENNENSQLISKQNEIDQKEDNQNEESSKEMNQNEGDQNEENDSQEGEDQQGLEFVGVNENELNQNEGNLNELAEENEKESEDNFNEGDLKNQDKSEPLSLQSEPQRLVESEVPTLENGKMTVEIEEKIDKKESNSIHQNDEKRTELPPTQISPQPETEISQTSGTPTHDESKNVTSNEMNTTNLGSTNEDILVLENRTNILPKPQNICYILHPFEREFLSPIDDRTKSRGFSFQFPSFSCFYSTFFSFC